MATTAATSLAKDYDLPWVEKYRPHRVSDIVGNQDVVARLQVIAQGGNMPNLIFSVSSFLPLLFTNLLKERENDCPIKSLGPASLGEFFFCCRKRLTAVLLYEGSVNSSVEFLFDQLETGTTWHWQDHKHTSPSTWAARPQLQRGSTRA